MSSTALRDPDTRQRLLSWYRTNHRRLPWRATHDPYRIMVSEVMLQQTQADRVVPKYHEFLARFPDLQTLAAAPAGEVIRAWSGLGYNRRAVNLQRAARAVVDDYGGQMPRDVDVLRRLPGIGPYTAGAIACFAFRQDVGFADTNIRRVLHRVIAGPELPEPSITPGELARLAQDLVPPGQGYEWNQALMELGATICRSRSANCDACPLAGVCRARPTIADVLTTELRRSAKREPRFETTNRYVRGRIIDILRGAPIGGYSAAEVVARMPIGKDTPDLERVAGLLEVLTIEGMADRERQVSEDGLAYDGLATDASDRFRLPG